MGIASIVICGGLGAKMVSRVPTVLHRIAGHPLFLYPLDVIRSLQAIDQIVVVGHEIESAPAHISSYPPVIDFVNQDQEEPGMDTVSRILDTVEADGLLIVEGDKSLLRAESIRDFCSLLLIAPATCLQLCKARIAPVHLPVEV